MQPPPTLKRKWVPRQGNPSRQEKVYADILDSEKIIVKRKIAKKDTGKENERDEKKQERRRRERETARKRIKVGC